MDDGCDRLYDVIVVGAGVEGSATGYYLTSRYTKNVLLLEQFSSSHTRGSSHGGSRATRKAYHQPFYVKMMNEAFQLWAEIEDKFGKTIYRKTKMLVFGDSQINPYIESLQLNMIPCMAMTGKEANERYPRQLKLPDSYICVIDEDAGVLRADIALTALQSLFVSNGGQVLDHHRVIRIIPGPVVTVETNRGRFKSKRVITTAGAWTNKLLEGTGLQLPLKVKRTEVMYWPVEEQSDFLPDSFPVFFFDHGGTTPVYGLPILEYPGLFKVCSHSGPEVDPDRRDQFPHSNTCDEVSRFISEHFKGVNTKPAIMELCMYTVTPDRDPCLDYHPLITNIIIAAGFSGHGFKLAPVVGKILSELALDKPLSYDLSPFKIDRFKLPKANL